jgi:hypothetical protein
MAVVVTILNETLSSFFLARTVAAAADSLATAALAVRQPSFH